MCEYQTNFSLKKHNTFGIDATAKYFAEFHSIQELKNILKSKIYKKHKTLVLGGGSNILITENFKGLIIHNKINGISIVKNNSNSIFVEVGSGVNWHNFVQWSVNRELSGIENLALIPGTVGAAPIQNIGAYGMEIKDTINKVYALNIKSQVIRVFSKSDCKFEYRNSIFKSKLKNKYIITKIEFQLSKTHLNKISYGDIKKELSTLKIQANPKNIANAVINIRNRKLPNPIKIGNSGSFFKNPIVDASIYEDLKSKFPNIVGYKISAKKTKIAAGWLIDNAGLKGYREGDAGVHKNQALVLVNYGNASGKNIVELSKKIQNIIFKKYGITILPEVNLI